ncbi:MAG: Na(+)-translocating NADH-quinone reductase subunit C [Pseudohongiellaceae bacterium]
MQARESTQKTLLVAFLLCVVCSIVVSGTAVLLGPLQDANRLLDRNRNILNAAGLYDPEVHTEVDVEAMFASFTPRIADLSAGEFLGDAEVAALGIDPRSYDQRNYLNDAGFSESVPDAEDIADIKRRVIYPTVYLQETAGQVTTIVLPINGYGLWGIMYGYLALEGDGRTVKGISFYEIKETPGLGAEVRNPRWVAQWPGKQIYDEDGEVALSVVKGQGEGDYEVDGLSGATLTSRGVDNMIAYWLGDDGYGPLLAQLRSAAGD